MSTTGWHGRDERRLAAELLERRHRVVRALGGAALRLRARTRAPNRRSRRGGRAAAARSGAPRRRRSAPSRSFSTASCAVGQSRPAPATMILLLAGRGDFEAERLLDRRRAATRCPRRSARRSRRPRTCSSRCGTTTARSPACRRSPRRRAGRAATQAFPVTSQTSPPNPARPPSSARSRLRARRRP